MVIQPMYTPKELIVDGQLIEENMNDAGITRQWLKHQLKQNHMQQSDVFFAELQCDGTLYIDKRHDKLS